MIPLTKPMRAALQAARRIDGLRRTHDPSKPGKPPWPAHPSTLAALVRHELVTRTDDRNRRGHPRTTWTITDAGRTALEPPARHKPDRARYLQRDIWRGGDYTTDPHRRIDDLEVMPEASPAWQRRAATRQADAEPRRTHARRLARNARAA